MSRMAERLARAEARLKEIEDHNSMQVVIAGDGGERKPIVIDFARKPAKSSTVPRSPRKRSSGSSRQTGGRGVEKRR